MFAKNFVCKNKFSPNCSPKQNCRRLPNFGGSPKFGSFQKIAQNFCAIFKIGQKRSKKFPNATKTLEKLLKQHKISTYLSKAPVKKSSRKAPNFLKKSTELFRCCHKYLKKLPKSSQILDRFQSGDSHGPKLQMTKFNLQFQVDHSNKNSDFLALKFLFWRFYFFWKNCSLKMKRNTKTIQGSTSFLESQIDSTLGCSISDTYMEFGLV